MRWFHHMESSATAKARRRKTVKSYWRRHLRRENKRVVYNAFVDLD